MCFLYTHLEFPDILLFFFEWGFKSLCIKIIVFFILGTLNINYFLLISEDEGILMIVQILSVRGQNGFNSVDLIWKMCRYYIFIWWGENKTYIGIFKKWRRAHWGHVCYIIGECIIPQSVFFELLIMLNLSKFHIIKN